MARDLVKPGTLGALEFPILEQNPSTCISFSLFLCTKGCLHQALAFPGGTSGKNLPVYAGDARDAGLDPGLGRSTGGGNGYPLQCSCLEKPTDRGAWWATVHVLVCTATLGPRRAGHD